MGFTRVRVVCTDTGASAYGDVLSKSKNQIKIAIGKGKDVTAIVLNKKNRSSPVFVGNAFGLEFTSDGVEERN